MELIRQLRAVYSSDGLNAAIEHLLGFDHTRIAFSYALMLVDLAQIDNEFDPEEHSFVEEALIELLQLNPYQAKRMVRRAERRIERGIDLDERARFLERRLSQADREKFAEVMNQLVQADRVVHPLESHLEYRYAELLNVGQREEDSSN